MPRKKFIARREDKLITSSCISNVENHESLGVKQEHPPEAQASTQYASLSSVMQQHRGPPFTVGSIYS
jgi:hypothetical protein